MRFFSSRTAAAVAAASVAGTLLLAPGAALANPPGPHDPVGAVESIKAVPDGVAVSGWAADPDSTANVSVGAILDGRPMVASTVTSVARPMVQRVHHTGVTPGFQMTIPVPSGNHTVCVVAFSVGPGISSLLRCFPLPLGRTLSPNEQAAQSPYGAITSVGAAANRFTMTGWATDPDFYPRRSVVVLYVDNQSAATVTSHGFDGGRPAGAGANSAWNVSVPVSAGTHVGCIWVVNVGWGSNTFLGCGTADTRGPAGTGPVTQPARNKAVVAEALRHLHQPYVWGATGPRSFDCSGLVLFSYNKAGITNVPRVSEAQFTAARLIPASRAVPGDLVFYFDNTGDVYHVGIYLSPGNTVAAIDEQEGVNYQSIWDPSHTAYGSFTHS